MTRLVWIAVVCAVAFVAYSAWQRSQVPRVPVTGRDAGAPAVGGGGTMDTITRTVDKLTGVFDRLFGKSSTPAIAPASSSSSGTVWI